MLLKTSPAWRTLFARFGCYPGKERARGKRKHEEIFMRARNDKREVV